MSIAENSTVSDNTLEEDLQTFDEAIAIKASGGRIAVTSCATVTADTVAKKITIDFGTGCTGRYGRTRSGKIIITYGGTFGDHMANRIITFENYKVNNRQIAGTIELRNFNRNSQNQLTAERKVIDYTVTFPNGNTFVLNGSTLRTWISGEDDEIVGNEVISITGSYEGISTNGRKYNRTITVPIIADFNCRATGGFLRISGTEEMTLTTARKNRTRTVNYGTGDCDNEFTITVNGKSKTVTVAD
jgi:hypothetical protein